MIIYERCTLDEVSTRSSNEAFRAYETPSVPILGRAELSSEIREKESRAFFLRVPIDACDDHVLGELHVLEGLILLNKHQRRAYNHLALIRTLILFSSLSTNSRSRLAIFKFA